MRHLGLVFQSCVPQIGGFGFLGVLGFNPEPYT